MTAAVAESVVSRNPRRRHPRRRQQ
jgi:hypothetical protein